MIKIMEVTAQYEFDKLIRLRGEVQRFVDALDDATTALQTGTADAYRTVTSVDSKLNIWAAETKRRSLTLSRCLSAWRGGKEWLR